MFKRDLREKFLEKRSRLSYQQSHYLSKKVSEHFFNNFDLSKISSIHVFLAIHHKAEIDTQFIIDKIWLDFPHIITVVPKLNSEKTDLETCLYTRTTILKQNSWGIPEPLESSELYPEGQIDLVLLPLLAFDEKGNRVGYGKGFYDRFLSRCKRKVLRIGLSFFDAVVEITDVSENDIPLTHCVTSEKLYDFTNCSNW